jgi:hypothetical protein
MEKLLILLFIRLIVRDTNEAIKIYEVIFKKENNKQPEYGNVTITKPKPKPVTKKEELLESLEFLRNKKVKTKQDKESIDIINTVLKNMV